jgi:hypothetical protein
MQKVLLVLAAIIYLLSPYDILPDFLVGWGWLDDLVIILILIRLINKLNLGTKGFQGRDQYKQRQFNSGDYKQHEGNGQQSSGGGFQQKNPYEVLGIPQNAGKEEIKRAYRKLANQYHPDKLTHLGEEFRALAEERFKSIQEAYQMLTEKKFK